MPANWVTIVTLTGRFAVAASLAYATWTFASRFDRAEAMLDKGTVLMKDFKETQGRVRRDLADLKATLPDAGHRIGEAGANAVTTMERHLQCPEDKPDCDADKGVRGLANRTLQRLHPDQP